MGNNNSVYENVEVTIPCVKYIDDDKGFNGKIDKVNLKIGKFTGSSDETGPLTMIRQLQKGCDEDEARALRNRQAILSATCTVAAPRFANYSNALLRIQSMDNSRFMPAEIIPGLAKMGFAAVQDERNLNSTLTCFWCGFKTTVPFVTSMTTVCDSLRHDCKYFAYMTEYIDVPTCIEENNTNLRLCGNCPLCRWNIVLKTQK